MKILISPERRQYKANLHCHSVLSDGRLTPQALKEMYKARGYAILAITDHERPRAHQALSEPGFVMLTGYECYIRPDESGRYNAYAPEVHLNLFAREPDNETMICMNERYCKYLLRDGALGEVTRRAGSERQRAYTRDYINEYIRTAKENGYLVAYNHPYWSMEDEADILSYEGCFSLEIANYGSYVMNGLEHCGALYDKMLRAGKRIFCHAADDNHNACPPEHPSCDSFGAFTMMMPDTLSYGGVIDAMERGAMYASMGPEIHSLVVDGNRVQVTCSPAAHIYLYDGGKRPAYVHAAAGEVLTGAAFDIDARARYIRISVRDAQGRWADTRGYTREEIGFAPLEEIK